MLFILFPLLCLIGNVLTQPIELVTRDTTVIDRSLRNVATALNRLSSAIGDINVRMSAADVSRRWPEVEHNCHAVSNLLYADAKDIRRAPIVNVLEAASLLTPINNLESSTQKVIDDWIAIKPAINSRDRANIQNILKDHQAAAGEYADALLSRQTAITSPVGRYFGSQTQAIIQKGINAYRT